MASTKAETLRAGQGAKVRVRAFCFRYIAKRRAFAYFYLVVALATTLFLCFLIPPIQGTDEGRHFLRALQIAQGQILPQINRATNEAGGWLPAAAVDFVRDKMNPEYYRNEDRLHTIGERLSALDRAAQAQPPLSEKEFGVFPASGIYPPSLYLPQTAGIWFARLFSDKVYIWFYSARIWNAVAATLLVFFALRIAPEFALALMIPAILPMSLYQNAAVSTDATVVALSILFVALCIRFIQQDSRWLRAGLIVCLLLLTLGKPVYLPFALLLLAAYQRIGWRRAILFCTATIAIALSAYLTWSYFVRPVLMMAGGDFAGSNPSVQAKFVLAHPIGFVQVALRTARLDGVWIISDLIGFFGWLELPLPHWFYAITGLFFLAVVVLAIANWRRIHFSRLLWGALAAVCIAFAIVLGAFVLWTPVGQTHILFLQGKYFIPVLAILPFLLTPLDRFPHLSRTAFATLVLCFFALSVITTAQTVKHYYFRDARIVGSNIHELFTIDSGRPCPAVLHTHYLWLWFSDVTAGTAEVHGNFRVLLADNKGTILGESDRYLAGAEFPYDLLPGGSRSRWLVHIWNPDRFDTLHYWLVTGKHACMFGAPREMRPYHIPEA